ncbi:MAG: SlyX family protein [Silanimonas sp.]
MPSPDRDAIADRRLTELETRLAFQEQAMQELSEALADARIEGQKTRELLTRVLDDLKQLRRALMADPASEPPPPHY